jgi:hypothetical protein
LLLISAPAMNAERARLHAGIDAVGAAQAEVHDGPAARREHRAHGLAHLHRLEMHQVHHSGLDELCLDDGRRDLQQGLVGKDRGALGDGPDLAGEANAAQELEERRLEPFEGGEVGDGLIGELEAFQEAEYIFESGGDQESARGRELSDEEAKGRVGGHSLPEVRRRHRELIEVGQERDVADENGTRHEGAPRPHRCSPLIEHAVSSSKPDAVGPRVCFQALRAGGALSSEAIGSECCAAAPLDLDLCSLDYQREPLSRPRYLTCTSLCRSVLDP